MFSLAEGQKRVSKIYSTGNLLGNTHTLLRGKVNRCCHLGRNFTTLIKNCLSNFNKYSFPGVRRYMYNALQCYIQWQETTNNQNACYQGTS